MAARSWGIAPSEIWGMTVSEMLTELVGLRGGGGQTYAGGMTAGDIEDMHTQGADLRARIQAARDGTETPTC